MKRYVKSAKFGPYKYKYGVYATKPHGESYTLGGSQTLVSANEIAVNQAKAIFESPWADDSEKFHRLDSIIVIDDETGEDVMLPDTEDYIDSLMSELDSRKAK